MPTGAGPTLHLPAPSPPRPHSATTQWRWPSCCDARPRLPSTHINRDRPTARPTNQPTNRRRTTHLSVLTTFGWSWLVPSRASREAPSADSRQRLTGPWRGGAVRQGKRRACVCVCGPAHMSCSYLHPVLAEATNDKDDDDQANPAHTQRKRPRPALEARSHRMHDAPHHALRPAARSHATRARTHTCTCARARPRGTPPLTRGW